MYGRPPDPRPEPPALPISAQVDPQLLRIDPPPAWPWVVALLAVAAGLGILILSVFFRHQFSVGPDAARDTERWTYAPEASGLVGGFSVALVAVMVMAIPRLRVITRVVICALLAILIGVLVGVGVHETGVRAHSQGSVSRVSQG